MLTFHCSSSGYILIVVVERRGKYDEENFATNKIEYVHKNGVKLMLLQLLRHIQIARFIPEFCLFQMSVNCTARWDFDWLLPSRNKNVLTLHKVAVKATAQ